MKKTLAALLALILCLPLAACSTEIEAPTPPTETSTEPTVTQPKETEPEETTLPRPLYFFETEELQFGTYDYTNNNSLPILVSTSGDYFSVYDLHCNYDLPDAKLTADGLCDSHMAWFDFCTRKFYGLEESPNLVEFPQIDFILDVGESPLNTPHQNSIVESDAEWLAYAIWDVTEKWAEYGFGSHAESEGSDVFQQYLKDFADTYAGYKVVSCKVKFDMGLLTEDAYLGYNSYGQEYSNCGINFDFLIVDKYTGTAYDPCNESITTSTFPSESGQVEFTVIQTQAARYYTTESESELPSDFVEELNYRGVEGCIVWSVLVPEDYDGLVFAIGPNLDEVFIPETEPKLCNLAEVPGYDNMLYYAVP